MKVLEDIKHNIRIAEKHLLAMDEFNFDAKSGRAVLAKALTHAAMAKGAAGASITTTDSLGIYGTEATGLYEIADALETRARKLLLDCPVPALGDQQDDLKAAREWAEGLAQFIDEMMPHGESSVESLPWKQLQTEGEKMRGEN